MLQTGGLGVAAAPGWLCPCLHASCSSVSPRSSARRQIGQIGSGSWLGWKLTLQKKKSLVSCRKEGRSPCGQGNSKAAHGAAAWASPASKHRGLGAQFEYFRDFLYFYCCFIFDLEGRCAWTRAVCLPRYCVYLDYTKGSTYLLDKQFWSLKAHYFIIITINYLFLLIQTSELYFLPVFAFFFLRKK